jgi:hypothetical protein
MRYPFMREFTGVSPCTTPAERERTRQRYLQFTRSMHHMFRDHVGDTAIGPGLYESSAGLYLYDDAGDELVVVERDESPYPGREQALVRFAVLVGAGVELTSHQYEIEYPHRDGQRGRVKRLDTDEPTMRGLDVLGMRLLIEQSQDADIPDTEADLPHISMDEFESLMYDEIDAEEVESMREYLFAKSASGVYVPVDFRRAMEIEGL